MSEEFEVGDIFPDLSGWDERPTEGRKPWHRPRKQYVREAHLRKLVEYVFERKPIDQRDKLKYLGLPGQEFLDIRYMLQLEDNAFGGHLPDVTYLGFDTEAASGGVLGSAARNSVNARSVDVDSLPRIRNSRVIKGDLRSIGHKNGTNRRIVREMAPFDIVNLDFCNSALADSPDRSDSLYQAMGEIFSMQRTAYDRWGLMITSRINRASIHDELLERMKEVLDANMETVPGFTDKYSSVHGREIDVWSEGDNEVFRVDLLLAIYKWISSIGVRNGMDVKLYKPLVYQVDPNDSCYDIASCAFVFKRRHDVVDALDTDSRLSQRDWPDEQYAADAIDRVAGRSDVDRRLEADSDLLWRCVSASKRLLTQAGVDVSGYEEWATGS